MSETRTQQIERLLTDRFEPSKLQIKDQSHLHAGHAGARDGKGHFSVSIVSAAFEGLSPIERHRTIFETLAEMMESDIHALNIRARTPDEN